MSSSAAAIFSLLCCFLSLHACTARVLRAKDLDHEQGLGPKFVMENMGSRLQESETASSLKTLSAITKEHPISLQKGRYGRSHGNSETGTPTVEERRLREKNAAAQEIDSNDSNDVVEDAVVMDYAQPHRKPPIHNEEN